MTTSEGTFAIGDVTAVSINNSFNYLKTRTKVVHKNISQDFYKARQFHSKIDEKKH